MDENLLRMIGGLAAFSLGCSVLALIVPVLWRKLRFVDPEKMKVPPSEFSFMELLFGPKKRQVVETPAEEAAPVTTNSTVADFLAKARAKNSVITLTQVDSSGETKTTTITPNEAGSGKA